MDEHFRILSLTLIGEAIGEPIQGIVGVGSVIRNRVFALGKTYSQVCLAAKQFSCWNEDEPSRNKLIKMSAGLDTNTDPYVRQCLYVANGILGTDLLDNTDGCQHYVTRKLYDTLVATNPNHWVNKMKIKVELGKQVFLYDPKKANTGRITQA